MERHGQQITLRMHGRAEYDGYVLFSDYLKQLDSFRAVLNSIARIVAGERAPEYKIISMSCNSPAVITLEAIEIPDKSDISALISKRLISEINRIQKDSKASDDIPTAVLGQIITWSGTSTQSIEGTDVIVGPLDAPQESVSITSALRENTQKIIGPDEESLGSISGRLEAINLHQQNVFWVYPPVGAYKIKCFFRKEQKTHAIEAIDKYVTIFGILRYKQRDDFPYAMDVDELVVNAPERLPDISLFDSKAPKPTGSISPDQFIRNLRGW